MIMEKVDVMRANGTECDFTIKVGSNTLQVHRVVIRAASEYFDRMLSHDTLENQNSTVNMKDVDFASVKKCVDFMYTGEIDVTKENVKGLLLVSSVFQLDSVLEEVAKILEDRLNAVEFFHIRESSVLYNLESLKEACDKYALENLEDIIKEEKFGDLDGDYVVSLLRNKISNHQDSEDSKLAIILIWINTDLENRKSELISMTTECLNLAKISPSYGLYVSETEKACYESSEFMKMLYTAQMKEQKYQPKEADICFNKAANSIMLFDISYKELKVYTPSEDHTRTLATLPDDLSGNKFYTACILANYCYVLLQNKTSFRLDIASPNNQWEKRRQMTNDHDWISCVSVGDSIFVGGGNSMEEYSSVNDTWSVINTDGIICDQSSLAANEDFVFCVGGSNNGDVLNHVARLRISNMTWQQVKPASHKRATPAVAVYDDFLYVAGGIHRSFLNDVEVYSIKTDSWTDISTMNMNRNLFGLCCLNGKIYAVGRKKEVLSIEVLDVHDNTWTMVEKDFNFAIMALAAVGF